MSTKTSIKRVALIAVSALGFGLMSVVPAKAGAQTSVTVSDASTTVFVGEAAQLPLSVVVVGATAAQAAADVVTLTPTLLTQPTGATVPAIPGGAANAIAANAAAVASNTFTLRLPGTGNAVSGTASAVYVPSAGASSTIVLTPATNAAAGTYSSGSLDFKANTPGTYTFAVTPTLGTTGSTVLTAGTFTVKVVSLGATIGDGGAVASPYTAVSGVAGPLNYVTLKATGAARTSSAVGTQVVVTGGTVLSASAGTVSADKTSVVIAGVNHATNAGTDSTIAIATPTVGTITVKTFIETTPGIYSSTAADTVTITVNAAAQSGTFSVANSTSLLDKDATAAGSYTAPAADETVLVANTPATAAGVIRVRLKDTLSAEFNGTVSATISGPGLVSVAGALASATFAGSGRADSAASSSGDAYIAVYADGTSGTGIITISVGSTVLSTETVKFYGAVASYTATVNKKHIPSSGAATTDVVSVTALDANGNAVPSATVHASVGTSTVATVEASDTTDATGVAKFNVTGLATKFGAVTITFGNAAASPTITTTAVVGVSSIVAASVTVTADKETYTPGEKITLTFTAKDANGLGLPDGSYAAGDLLANAATNPSATASFTSTPFIGNAAVVLVAGVATAEVFAPLASGPISWTWTLGGTAGTASTNLASTITATKVTASAKVGASAAETAADAATEAAVEATDAANQAYEAAVVATETAEAAVAAAEDAKAAADAATAAVEALATQVSTMMAELKAQVTALAKTVAKILKRV